MGKSILARRFPRFLRYVFNFLTHPFPCSLPALADIRFHSTHKYIGNLISAISGFRTFYFLLFFKQQFRPLPPGNALVFFFSFFLKNDSFHLLNLFLVAHFDI